MPQSLSLSLGQSEGFLALPKAGIPEAHENLIQMWTQVTWEAEEEEELGHLEDYCLLIGGEGNTASEGHTQSSDEWIIKRAFYTYIKTSLLSFYFNTFM